MFHISTALIIRLTLLFTPTVALATSFSLREAIKVPVFSEFDANKMLSPAEMREDIDNYIFAIAHAYSGYYFVPERGSQAFVNLLNTWKPTSSLYPTEPYRYVEWT
jgi:hypothetical protein